MADVDRVLTSPDPPSPEPGTVLLTTDRLIIRRPLLSDAPALAQIANHREAWAFMTDRFPHPYTLADAEAFLSTGHRTDKTTHAHPLEYPQAAGIFLKKDGGGEGALVGTLGMRPGEDINYRMWDIGYFLGPDYWGKGYMTEAVGAFVRWCFEKWPRLVRIQGSTYEFNEASGRVLTKSGFVREGLRRDSAEKQGKVTGEIFYGLLRSDIGQS